MPILAVGRCASGDVGRNAGQGSGASGAPETDGTTGEVDIVGKVIPGTSSEVSGPLGLSTDAPVELGEVGSNSDFQLGEVRLEEEDLVLRGTWWVCGLMHDREVVVHLTGSQVG